MFWIQFSPAINAIPFLHWVGQFPVARLVLPLPLAGRLALLFAARAGAVFLAEGGFGIWREPLLAATAFSLAAMLFHAPPLNGEGGARLKPYSSLAIRVQPAPDWLAPTIVRR